MIILLPIHIFYINSLQNQIFNFIPRQNKSNKVSFTNYLTELKIKYVKFQNYTFMKIKKYFMKDKNLYLKKGSVTFHKISTHIIAFHTISTHIISTHIIFQLI